MGVARCEEQQLRRAARENARFLVVDDYPSTGGTLRTTSEILRGFGIGPEQIVILAPTHPAQPDWVPRLGIDRQIPIVTIYSSELHKNALLASNPVETRCRGYFASAGWEQARVVQDDGVRKINVRLARLAITPTWPARVSMVSSHASSDCEME